MTVDKDGKKVIDNAAVLDTRETFIPLDLTKPFKLNADTKGVCKFTTTSPKVHKLTHFQTASYILLNDLRRFPKKRRSPILSFLSMTGWGWSMIVSP